ncbi:unnamed protein product [Cyprideis torosa]|uniref:Uncharacterized protein n=1 Tax=Cyprideis torosa TaxID=163714 RepID=A0A7R8ZKH9_9CRUS|nr:unnamed protein product [Cyprideis torosa]CAG0889426.1 unnamed protein product [Cyprideis torosa]
MEVADDGGTDGSMDLLSMAMSEIGSINVTPEQSGTTPERLSTAFLNSVETEVVGSDPILCMEESEGVPAVPEGSTTEMLLGEQVEPTAGIAEEVSTDTSNVVTVAHTLALNEERTPEDSEIAEETSVDVQEVIEDEPVIQNVAEHEANIQEVTEGESIVQEVTEFETVVQEMTEDESVVQEMTEFQTVVQAVTEDESVVQEMTEDESVVQEMTEFQTVVQAVTEDESVVQEMTEDESVVQEVNEVAEPEVEVIGQTQAIPRNVPSDQEDQGEDPTGENSEAPVSSEMEDPLMNVVTLSDDMDEDSDPGETLPVAVVQIKRLSSENVARLRLPQGIPFCVVDQCRNAKGSSDVHCHSIPLPYHELRRCLQWLFLVGRFDLISRMKENSGPAVKYRICTDHFDHDDLIFTEALETEIIPCGFTDTALPRKFPIPGGTSLVRKTERMLSLELGSPKAQEMIGPEGNQAASTDSAAPVPLSGSGTESAKKKFPPSSKKTIAPPTPPVKPTQTATAKAGPASKKLSKVSGSGSPANSPGAPKSKKTTLPSSVEVFPRASVKPGAATLKKAISGVSTRRSLSSNDPMTSSRTPSTRSSSPASSSTVSSPAKRKRTPSVASSGSLPMPKRMSNRGSSGTPADTGSSTPAPKRASVTAHPPAKKKKVEAPPPAPPPTDEDRDPTASPQEDAGVLSPGPPLLDTVPPSPPPPSHMRFIVVDERRNPSSSDSSLHLTPPPVTTCSLGSQTDPRFNTRTIATQTMDVVVLKLCPAKDIRAAPAWEDRSRWNI